jgi:hypothetical protein
LTKRIYAKYDTYCFNSNLAILAAIWGATVLPAKTFSLRLRIYRKVKSYDRNAVHSIVIKNSLDSLELKNEAGVWKVNGKGLILQK